MLRTLPVHLMALAVWITANVFVLHAVSAALPDWLNTATVVITVVGAVGWLALLAWRLARREPGLAQLWRRHDRIVMWTGAMRATDPALRARAARRVEWAFDATEDLLRRILNHLRLEAGAVEAQIAPFGVGVAMARAAEMNEPSARLAGVQLRVLPSRLTALGDAALAERVLGNLLGNALRHAKAGRVLMGARRRTGRVCVWVIDDGVGVAEADLARLFDDYVQGSDHGDEIRGGFGLGLASAQRMARLMGGGVGLERKWRRGSAFWLELPVADAKAA